VGELRLGRSPAAAASWQGAARAKGLRGCIVVARCPGCDLSDDERRPFGHFETRSGPGDGQHQPYPGNWYGVPAPYTTGTTSTTTESPTRPPNQLTIAVLIAVPDTASSRLVAAASLLCCFVAVSRLASPRLQYLLLPIFRLCSFASVVSENEALLLFCLHSIGRFDEAALLFHLMYQVFLGL
jgi:hypothetical protein